MCESVSILLHISNKIDTRIDMSCEYNPMIFILRFYICYIVDNVTYTGKITIAYYHNRRHDEVKDILHNILFYIHYKLDQVFHLFQSNLNNFLLDTFFYLDVILQFDIVEVFCTFF